MYDTHAVSETHSQAEVQSLNWMAKNFRFASWEIMIGSERIGLVWFQIRIRIQNDIQWVAYMVLCVPMYLSYKQRFTIYGYKPILYKWRNLRKIFIFQHTTTRQKGKKTLREEKRVEFLVDTLICVYMAINIGMQQRLPQSAVELARESSEYGWVIYAECGNIRNRNANNTCTSYTWDWFDVTISIASERARSRVAA